MKRFELQCMHGADADRAYAGNTAIVTLGPPPSAGVGTDSATQVFLDATAALWRVASFTAAGQPIRFCGHGALAAARVAFDESGATGALKFATPEQQWTATQVAPTDAAEEIVLRYVAPGVEPCRVPDFAAAALGVEVSGAARAGGPQDYWVLETSTAAAVAAARPDAAQLMSATRRAIVLVAATPDGAAMRYFAPQYGVPEDPATGSAAVQLGAYWCATRGAAELTVRQLSAAGGWFRLRCHTGVVELAARVAYR